jgi:site-specific DNA recombinase
MERVAIYYRTSKNFTNQERMQKMKCREYCKINKWKIFKEYSDLKVSGCKRNRKALGELIADSDNFSKVIVYSIDRLGRRVSVLNNIDSILKKKNITLISATQKFDDITPEGKFAKGLHFLLAEYESTSTSKRTKDGLKARKMQN